MRVTAGTLKGRLLVSPKKSNVRPTTDKVRSAIYSIIDSHVRDAKILDLYAGTGSFGIDGLSRGALHCTFVDLDPKWLRENLKLLDSGQYRVKKGDCLRVLKKMDHAFDIIFADPPYGIYCPEAVLQVIKENKILANDGVLIYEECAKISLNIDNSGFEILDFRKYGDTGIHFLRLRE